MNAPRPWPILALSFALLLPCCGRDVADAIQDNSRELSGLRKAIQALDASPRGEAPPKAQLDEALAPLRDVLLQLGSAQQQLAERQQSLAQEMRRWTQLIVQQQQQQQRPDAQADAEAAQLAERLRALEQSMQQQDERHREVEKLLQGALDHTSERLQDFLERLEASNRARRERRAEAGSEPPGDTAPRGGGTSGGAATGDPPAGEQPPGSGDGAPERRAGAGWWWGLIGLVLVCGGWLLVTGRRRRPVAIAREMQTSPPTDVAEPQVPFADIRDADEFDQRVQAPIAPADVTAGVDLQRTDDTRDDEPEVEELWAAAALLGEAIGKLRQNGVDPAETLPPPDVRPPGEAAVGGDAPDADMPDQDGVDLDDLFVLDEPGEHAPSPRAADPDAAAPPRTTRAPVRDEPKPIQCWLSARDATAAERRVRQLLQSDPRVLVAPAPDVQPAGGELHVSFSVLPGLPAGERSLIEQRLRDGVA